jgi:hypothetical protein
MFTNKGQALRLGIGSVHLQSHSETRIHIKQTLLSTKEYKVLITRRTCMETVCICVYYLLHCTVTNMKNELFKSCTHNCVHWVHLLVNVVSNTPLTVTIYVHNILQKVFLHMT